MKRYLYGSGTRVARRGFLSRLAASGRSHSNERTRVVRSRNAGTLTHVVHSNLPVNRRNYHHIVGSIDTGVHDARREHRLDHDDKTSTIISCGRHLEIKIGGDNHLRQRVVQTVGLLVVRSADRKPDTVEVDGRSKSRSRGAISTTWVESGGISGRSTVVSSSGGGLRYRPAKCIGRYRARNRSDGVARYRGRPCPALRGLFTLGQGRVYLFADPLADGRAFFNSIVIAAALRAAAITKTGSELISESWGRRVNERWRFLALGHTLGGEPCWEAEELLPRLSVRGSRGKADGNAQQETAKTVTKDGSVLDGIEK